MAKPTERILDLLMVSRQPLSSSRIADICGLGSWRLYPALIKLENEGMITSEWDEFSEVVGAPRQRLYQISRFVRED